MIVDVLSKLLSYLDLTTFTVFLVITYVAWTLYEERNLPPGPWGLPILGYLPFMKKGPVEGVIHDLCKKYGNIISIKFGSTLVVVLDDYETIKEAYVKQGDIFAGRTQTIAVKIDKDDGGIINSDGEPWREHRRFILSTFRDYGMGKLSLEPKIIEEIHFFLDALAKEKGEPFDFSDLLGMSTANIISTLEFGKRFEYSDARFKKMRTLQDEAIELFSSVSARAFFPWLQYVPFADRLTHMTRIREIGNEMKEFLHIQMQEHRDEYLDNSKKDLIDAYITERNSVIKKIGHEGHFNDHELEGTLGGLFGAGTETTSTTLRWAVHMLLINPHMQTKVQKEIDEVIGMERSPTMFDKNQMVYTEAVLLEAQRFGSIVALNVPHDNLEETELCGYRIPKRTMILTNLWAVHRDPKLWDQPEEFIPERFINKEGRIEKPEHLIPFGIGKRACVGESLARMELFLYFTSLLQRFNLHPPNGEKPTLSYESMATRRPKAYKVCALQREGYSV